jgi:GntR family transcriptional repressor for pyruvate dehydrogenase complex
MSRSRVPVTYGRAPAGSDVLMPEPNGSPKRRMQATPEPGSAIARPEKVAKAVARLVAKGVADRKLRPGTPLPPEQEMAAQYGVGRASVREALRLLETQGLIIIRPGVGGGPIVAEPSADDFGRTMSMFLQFQDTPYSHVLDGVIALEGMCAAVAAERCASGGPELFDHHMPQAALEPPRRGLSDVDWIDQSTRFHYAIYDLMGNDALTLIVKGVGFIFSDRAKFDEHKGWAAKDRKRIHAEHIEIGEAIRAGDVDLARSLAEAHFRKINASIRRSYPGLASEAIDWR